MTIALWGACHGGRLPTARYLLSQGADIDWIGYDGLTPLDMALASKNADLTAWLTACGAHTRAELPPG